MKRLVPAVALLCVLAACQSDTSKIGYVAPTPTATAIPSSGDPASPGAPPGPGLLAARFNFCRDLAGASGIIYRPVETLTSPHDAAPIEGWIVKLREDIKTFDQVGNTAAATQARAFVDAVSRFAKDVGKPVPSNPEAAKKWKAQAIRRRTGLLRAIGDEVRPFLPYCAQQLRTR